MPLGVIFARTFEHGVGAVWSSITTPAAVSAFWLTVTIAAIAVPLNTVFGVGCALALVRGKTRGRAVLDALVDVPFIVSPVIIGLALVLVYGQGGWFGDWLIAHGLAIIYTPAGMVLATIFVSLPFVVREVVPVLIEVGDEQEQAAATLGASAWQTFWRVTLPSIRWAVAYGVVLTTARALGEFGAVSVVSSKVAGSTLTLPLLVSSALRPGRRRRSVRRLRGGDAAGCDVARRAAADDRARAGPQEPGAMRIDVDSVAKRFGEFTALDDVSARGPQGLADGAAGAERLREVDAAADRRRARAPRLRSGADRRRRRDGGAPPGSRDRVRLPALRGVRPHERA